MDCSVQEELKDICKKTTLIRRVGLFSSGEIDENELYLIKWGSGIVCSIKAVCYHHKVKFLDRYLILQRFCCDPMNVHKSKIKIHLREISEAPAKDIGKRPGDKLCKHCWKNAQKNAQEENENYDVFIPPN